VIAGTWCIYIVRTGSEDELVGDEQHHARGLINLAIPSDLVMEQRQLKTTHLIKDG
jgi:hypothetical protein